MFFFFFFLSLFWGLCTKKKRLRRRRRKVDFLLTKSSEQDQKFHMSCSPVSTVGRNLLPPQSIVSLDETEVFLLKQRLFDVEEGPRQNVSVKRFHSLGEESQAEGQETCGCPKGLHCSRLFHHHLCIMSHFRPNFGNYVKLGSFKRPDTLDSP